MKGKQLGRLQKESSNQAKAQARLERSRVRTSILLLLLALVAVTATTVAWFSIADRARVRTMSLDIISGVDLRMDLDAHDTKKRCHLKRLHRAFKRKRVFQ